MKLIDLSAKKGSGKQLGSLGRAFGNLGSPFSKKEILAHEAVTNILTKALDNRFSLLCNVQLEGLEVPIPRVLVGPTGMWVLYASPTKGIFRANENTWEEFEESTSQFKLGKPNLLGRSVLLARAVESFLTRKEVALPEVEPVLFFSDPGVHVDATRPAARIVLADGLERFVGSVLHIPLVLDSENIQKIVEALTGAGEAGGSGDFLEETRDAFSYMDLPEKKPARPSPMLDKLSSVGRGEPAFAKTVSSKNPFNRRQWVVLSLLVLLVFLLMIGLIFIFLIYSPIG